MKKILGTLLVVLTLLAIVPLTVAAAPTADISVTAIPQSISITVSPTSYDFGEVAASASPSTNTTHFTIDNTSNVVTNQTISVQSANWTGGTQWVSEDSGTPGADTAALKANKGGTWGVSDVVVKYAGALTLALNQAATTDYSFGIKLLAPTSYSDATEKSITIRITASA